MTKKKRGSSSVYRTGTDSVKIRLIVLIVLAALLLLTALCAKYICPYDPYEQNLLLAKQPPGPEHLLGTDRYGRDMFSRILTGGTTSIFSTLILVSITTVTGTFVGDYLRLARRFRGCFSYEDIRSVSGLSKPCVCIGCGRSSGRRRTECSACAGCGKLAEVCQAGQRADAGSERSAIYNGGQTFRQQHTGSASAAYSA